MLPGQHSAVHTTVSLGWPLSEHHLLPCRPQEWDKKWRGKDLRLRHPDSGETMDVKARAAACSARLLACCLRARWPPCPRMLLSLTHPPETALPPPPPQVVDTCDDNDCSGCCTANAKRNGGTLIDLEINTARRFWGKASLELSVVLCRPLSIVCRLLLVLLTAAAALPSSLLQDQVRDMSRIEWKVVG